MQNKRKGDKSYKLAYYNTKDKTRFTSIGGYYSPRGSNVKFVRDPVKLYHQYHNLIYAIGKKYSVYFPDNADREDLFEYVKDAFISLVYEYDIDSKVDFKGYVKHMLEKRVRESYSKREKKRKEHIAPLKDRNTNIEQKLDYNQTIGDNKAYIYRGEYTKNNRRLDDKDKSVEVKIGKILKENLSDFTYFEFIDYLKSQDSVTQVQLDLANLLIEGQCYPNEAKKILMEKYDLSRGDINSEFIKLKDHVLDFIRK